MTDAASATMDVADEKTLAETQPHEHAPPQHSYIPDAALEQAMKRIREEHPDWSEDRIFLGL